MHSIGGHARLRLRVYDYTGSNMFFVKTRVRVLGSPFRRPYLFSCASALGQWCGSPGFLRPGTQCLRFLARGMAGFAGKLIDFLVVFIFLFLTFCNL